MFSNCVRIRRECRNRCIHQSMWSFRRTNTLCQYVLNICHYDTWANDSRPERVRLCVHTTKPTGPVPEPFHGDHIARWLTRSGTTGRSGTGVNTGARLRSGCVPVPKPCSHHSIRGRWARLVGGLWREVNYTVTQLMHSECGRICRGPFVRGPYKRGSNV